ncbi:5-formyltetrahydrofolate cyclo-ligase [Rummeliibacillus stabekisii]|uniref:5-formyltetrahydrofolate cyclo-ligase n=1 Tax=Rummeliibacillus stabekisii TaxID=241244 RepID=UPI0037222B33
MDKKDLRNAMQLQLKQLAADTYKEKSAIIHSKLLDESAIKDASVIGITLSNFPEVDTWPLIEELWARGRSVAVPKCHPKTREMTFYEITSFDQVEIGYSRISEPIPNRTKVVKKEEIQCLIVPGLAYDKDGFRLGFGGGYYDRYLSNYRDSTISLAFQLQVVEKIPRDDYDLSIGKIITEREIILVEQK